MVFRCMYFSNPTLSFCNFSLLSHCGKSQVPVDPSETSTLISVIVFVNTISVFTRLNVCFNTIIIYLFLPFKRSLFTDCNLHYSSAHQYTFRKFLMLVGSQILSLSTELFTHNLLNTRQERTLHNILF